MTPQEQTNKEQTNKALSDNKDALKGIVALIALVAVVYIIYRYSKNGGTEFVTIASDKMLEKIAGHMVKSMF